MQMSSIEIWDSVHKTRQWGTCPEPAVARWAMRRWGGADRDAKGLIRLLEVGCGVGAMAFWLASNGFLVDAIDASQAAIDRAERLHGNILPHSLLFRVSGIEDFPNNIGITRLYDGIVDVCCLQHVESLGKAVESCAAALKPGGSMLSIFASERHSPILAGTELERAAFHRLTALEVYDVFPASLFREVHLEQMMHTDRGCIVAHWIIEAIK